MTQSHLLVQDLFKAFFITVMCISMSCASASAQEYGVIDTIRVSKSYQSVVAYRDTVMIYVGAFEDTPRRTFIRLGRNAPWDSVEFGANSVQPPMVGCVMASADQTSIETDTGTANVGLIGIMRAARSPKQIITGRPGDKITVRPLKRIRIHPANTHKIYVQFEIYRFGGYYTATYVTNNDGETWKEIDPPLQPSDAARKHVLGFDYNDPQGVYIYVDGASHANPNAIPRTHYTDDDGVTFKGGIQGPVESAGYGIWSKKGGVSGSEYGISFHTDSIGLPLGSPRMRIEPPWLANVRKSLLPNYDSTTQRLRYAFDNQSWESGSITGLAFHPERPETFAAEFRFDTLVGATWYPRNFVVATTDFGQTWAWVIKVNDLRKTTYNGIRALVVDPLDNGIYCSYQLLIRDSTTGRTTYLDSYTIKSTPRTTSVAGDERVASQKQSRVYPNPVRNGTPLTIDVRGIDESGDLYVTCSTLDGRVVETSQTITLDTQNLSPGVYAIAVFLRGKAEHHLVVMTK